MHLVKIYKIEYHPSSKGYILILEKDKNKIQIPILIGSNEAQALSLAYEDIKLPRPTTHDLIISLTNELDANIECVIIKKYQNGTFLSSIMIKKGSETIELDSRPSDAISIAEKEKIPMYVTEDILKTVKSKNLISKPSDIVGIENWKKLNNYYKQNNNCNYAINHFFIFSFKK